MALQLSEDVRNARLDAVESVTGTSAVLKIFTGAQPADCAAADSGSLLVTITLPSNWMTAAASGVKDIAGLWADIATGTGTAAHFRLYDSGVTDCHVQGAVSDTGGSGDLKLNTVAVVTGKAIEVTAFTLTDANA